MSYFTALLQKLINELDCGGGSFIIQVDGATRYEKGFGSFEGTPITMDTVLPLKESFFECLVSLSISILVEENRIEVKG